jgi:sodium transport system permease protein
LNPRDIWVLYSRELRASLRERAIVVNSILMPIFLYPVLLWVMFSGLVFVQGLQEGFGSRIGVVDEAPRAHRPLLDSLEADEGVELRSSYTEEAGMERLRNGELDALLIFRPAPPSGQALPDNFALQVRYDRSEARSQRALSRVEEVADDYRSHWIEESAAELGIRESSFAPFDVRTENVSTESDVGAVILGQMISLFLVVMVALGCFYPAVDTTAGERERSTWETLMTTSASRMSVVTAKYLYVATLGITAGILNVLALFVSMGAVVAPILGDSTEIQFSLPLLSVPVMMAGAAALALFFAAAMMILAAFARTFKDGQAMIQPVYWLVFLPFLLGQQTDQTLTPTLAAIPVANIAMMIRDAINGIFLWPLIGLTLAVTLLLVVACLLLARTILGFEDFLLGSYDGSFWRFLRDRLRPGAKQGTHP